MRTPREQTKHHVCYFRLLYATKLRVVNRVLQIMSALKVTEKLKKKKKRKKKLKAIYYYSITSIDLGLGLCCTFMDESRPKVNN